MARLKEFDETKVLNKAVELFWHRGYNNTNYSQIVKHLGINRSSIYDTYGNKEALFIAALKHYLKSNHGGEAPSFEEPRALIESFFQDKLQSIQADKERKGCFAVNCTVEFAAQAKEDKSQLSEVRDILSTNFKNFVNTFSSLFQTYIEDGKLDKDKNPKQMAEFLFATINSIQLMSRQGIEIDVLEEARFDLRAHFEKEKYQIGRPLKNWQKDPKK